MLEEKMFQKGFLVIEILTCVLIGIFILPFSLGIIENYEGLSQFPIWVIEIFFAILTIIIAVVTFKIWKAPNNNLRVVHLFLTFCTVAIFIIQISICFVTMSKL